MGQLYDDFKKSSKFLKLADKETLLGVYVRNRKEMESDYINFRKASDLWHWKNEDIKPKLFDFPALLKLGGN